MGPSNPPYLPDRGFDGRGGWSVPQAAGGSTRLVRGAGPRSRWGLVGSLSSWGMLEVEERGAGTSQRIECHEHYPR